MHSGGTAILILITASNGYDLDALVTPLSSTMRQERGGLSFYYRQSKGAGREKASWSKGKGTSAAIFYITTNSGAENTAPTVLGQREQVVGMIRCACTLKGFFVV